MEDQQILLSRIPFRGVTFVSNLIILEYPILSLFVDENQELIFGYWADYTDQFDQWLMWKVANDDFSSFIYKEYSLREVLLSNKKDNLYLVDIFDQSGKFNFENRDSYGQVRQLTLKEVDPQWLPEVESFYDFELPEEVKAIFEGIIGTGYIQKLRNKAVYFNLSPIVPRYATTVSTLDVSSFLAKLTKSFLNYVEFKFSQTFRHIYEQEEILIQTLKLIKSTLTPRVSDLEYSSFEVGLSTDFTNPANLGADYYKWQLHILSDFKRDVIDLDFDSEDTIQFITDNYPAGVRRAIFDPIFEISSSKNYLVKVSDKRKKDVRVLDNVSQDTRRTVSSKISKPKDAAPENLKLMNYVVSIPEGQDLSQMDKRKLKRSTLSASERESLEIEYSDDFSLKGFRFQFIRPLPCQIITRGQIMILICSPLGLDVNSISRDELFNRLQQEIQKLFMSSVANNPNSNKAMTFYSYINVQADA